MEYASFRQCQQQHDVERDENGDSAEDGAHGKWCRTSTGCELISGIGKKQGHQSEKRAPAIEPEAEKNTDRQNDGRKEPGRRGGIVGECRRCQGADEQHRQGCDEWLGYA